MSTPPPDRPAQPAPLTVWERPEVDALGPSPEAWLARLPGPTWFRIPGRDRERCRAWTTLLHGNEPSGLRALYAFLAEKTVPAVDLVCFVGAVAAARTPPRFTHRALPGRPDLNRCFRPPFDSDEGALAACVLAELEQARPEALVDVHNTSGAGPAYAVATRADARHRALAGLLTEHLIRTDLRLGALMEAAPTSCTSVTLECGGSGDPRADALAREALQRFAECDEPFASEPARVFEHPIRVELAPQCELAYAHRSQPGADLTLSPDIDRHNFSQVEAGESLGWVGARGLLALRAVGGDGRAELADFLGIRDGRLVSLRPFRPFMITTQPQIARADCLFYLIPA